MRGSHIDKTLLALGERTGDQYDWVKAKDCHVFLVVGVEMGHVMRSTDFRKHANNVPKKRLSSGMRKAYAGTRLSATKNRGDTISAMIAT